MPVVYRLRFIVVGVALTIASMCAVPMTATAAAKEKGLLITPVRKYIGVSAGAQKSGSFSVANLTGKPAVIKLAVKQFSVANYVYDYRFNEPNNDWLRLSTLKVALQSGESRKINYVITVPDDAAPGGHYYSLFASAELSTAGMQGTVQAATLLYITVDGKLVETSQVRGHSIPRLIFGQDTSYTLDILNTGNVHYFVYPTSQMHGFSARQAQNETAHLLLPQKIRRISGSIPAPRLPGIYKVTIDYRKEGGGSAQTVGQYVVYLPPWSVATLLLLLLIGAKSYKRRAEKSQAQAPRD